MQDYTGVIKNHSNLLTLSEDFNVLKHISAIYDIRGNTNIFKCINIKVFVLRPDGLKFLLVMMNN